MRLKSKKILGIPVTTSSKKEILEYLQKCLENPSQNTPKTLIIVTPNPEQVVYGTKHPHFADILNQADVAIPDGIGLVWAHRFIGLGERLARIAGVVFMEDLVELAAKERIPIGLIGGRGGVAVKALECLQQKYPRVQGWAIEPEVEVRHVSNLSYLRKKIEVTGTQMVFVGLGAPKQEYVIENLKAQIAKLKYKKPVVFMAVGGAFDEISGRLPMPPRFIDRVGLKWLWRLILEPWRWRRQLALIQFILLVLKEKLA